MKETSPATSGEHGVFRALYEYAADVQPDGGGAVFRTEIDEPFDIPGWFRPGVGDVLPVRCDPRRGKAKFDMGRLKAATKERTRAAKDAQSAAFDAAIRSAPGTPAVAPLDQLEQLSVLHDHGALSDEEFAAAKAKILGAG